MAINPKNPAAKPVSFVFPATPATTTAPNPKTVADFPGGVLPEVASGYLAVGGFYYDLGEYLNYMLGLINSKANKTS